MAPPRMEWLRSFPVHHGPSADGTQSRERGRRRYERALARLRDADIPTRADPEAGAREYVERRAQWETDIAAVAPALGYRMEEVDRAGYGGASRAVGG